MDDEARLKLQAKRFNEHIKLFVTTLNVIALTIFGAGVLQPLVAADSSDTPAFAFNMIWIALSVALHFVAQGLIRLGSVLITLADFART